MDHCSEICEDLLLFIDSDEGEVKTRLEISGATTAESAFYHQVDKKMD